MKMQEVKAPFVVETFVGVCCASCRHFPIVPSTAARETCRMHAQVVDVFELCALYMPEKGSKE